jgi:hypothetical protein
VNPTEDLTIVTSVTSEYVRFLDDWAASLKAQTVPPAAVILVGNGLGGRDRDRVRLALAATGVGGAFVDQSFTGCGAARNVAVRYSSTPWCSHLDADDVLLPSALEQVAALADEADVVSLGYKQWWPDNPAGYPKVVVYPSLEGMEALGDVPRIASGCSPFRRAFWEIWPYPEHLEAGWDYGLWLGFAHLGARFRPTAAPAFLYRQHPQSHWRRVGQHRHADLIGLRRRLEQYGVERTKEQLAAAGATIPPEVGQ